MLKVEHLSVKNEQNVLKVNDFSFDIHAGEIVGIAGVDGNGQTELVNAITGLGPVATAKSPSAVRTSRMRPSASGSLPEFPISRRTGSGAVWCWISRWRKTSSLDAAARSRFPPTAS